VNESWNALNQELRAALDAFVAGDADPYKRLWSHRDDVSIFGAFGGCLRGWNAIAERLDWAASQYHEGVYGEFTLIAEGVTPDLAYSVWTEKITSMAPDGSAIVRERRGTQIYRMEGRTWRIVHQHSDPLVRVDPPGT
jgi:ketosteroid isomerase-like protein